MVKFNSTHGHINIREIGKPVKKETDLMGRPAFTFRHTVKITFNDKSTQFISMDRRCNHSAHAARQSHKKYLDLTEIKKGNRSPLLQTYGNLLKIKPRP